MAKKKKIKRKYSKRQSRKLKKHSRKNKIFNTKTKKKINLKKYIKRQKGGMMEPLLYPRRVSLQESTRTYYLDICTQLIKKIYDKLVKKKFYNNELLKDLKSGDITEDIIRKLLNIVIAMYDGKPASSVIAPVEDVRRPNDTWYSQSGTEYKNMLMESLPEANWGKIVEVDRTLGQIIWEKESAEAVCAEMEMMELTDMVSEEDVAQARAMAESKGKELVNIRRKRDGLWDKWDSAFSDSYGNIEKELMLVLSVVVNAMNKEEKYLRNSGDFDSWYNALDPPP